MKFSPHFFYYYFSVFFSFSIEFNRVLFVPIVQLYGSNGEVLLLWKSESYIRTPTCNPRGGDTHVQRNHGGGGEKERENGNKKRNKENNGEKPGMRRRRVNPRFARATSVSIVVLHGRS